LANVTATTADKFINEVWSDELNRAIEYDIVIAGLFSDWTRKMAGSGDVFHLPAGPAQPHGQHQGGQRGRYP